MNMTEFLRHRDALLREKPGMLDLSETRFAKRMAPYLPGLEGRHLPEKAYRCHLVEDWLTYFGLPPYWKPRAMASLGVRQSLEVLFEAQAAKGGSLALPEDVYPVYWHLAHAAGLETKGYPTLPAIRRESLPDAKLLLLANPVKPRGSELAGHEVVAVLDWLAADCERRVVVDAVYTFGRRFSPATMLLERTGQAFILHSLSKGWADPLTFGVALVPSQDVARFQPLFRALVPEPGNLVRAWSRFRQDLGLPEQLGALVKEANQRMTERLWEKGLPLDVEGGPVRYMHLMPMKMEALLQLGILGLPLSVFGSRAESGTILSSLNFLR